MGRNDYHGAIVLLECARRLSGVDQPSLLALGDLYFNEGLYGKATSCYVEAGKGKRLSTDTRVRYAEALLEAGQPLLAEKLISREPSGNVNQPERLQIVRARLALAKKDTSSATAHLHAAIRACPMNGDALLMLAHVQKEEGELDRALLTLERASRVESHKRRALLGIAEIHVDRSGYEEALEALEEAQALQFDPHVARYMEHIRKASQE